MPKLCSRLGCSYGADYLVRWISAHFTPGEDLRRGHVCTVCKDEHVETLHECGNVVAVRRVET